MNKMKLEHGFTLLELLASIVIIVIVLTSFFSFFSQSAMFSKKNEENLVAMNLAREVLETVKKEAGKEEDGIAPSRFPSSIFDGSNCLDSTKINQAKGILNLNDDGTFKDVDNQLYPCLSLVSETDVNVSEVDYKLMRVMVEIYQKAKEAGQSDQLLTKTYGYVREKK